MNRISQKGKILVSGSSGLIGQQLCEHFLLKEIPFKKLKRRSSKNDNQPKDSSTELPVQWPEELHQIDFSPYTAYIHLALAPIKQDMVFDTVQKENFTPLKEIAEAIKRTNPECHIVFLSSQAATEDASSSYGKVKFQSEQFLENSDLSWTILTPGLIVDPSGKGIFAKIDRAVRSLPLVPLLSGKQFVQLVSVHDVCKAIECVIKEPETHQKKRYKLALSPIDFSVLLRKIGQASKKRKVYITIPTILVDLGLRLLEKLLKTPPISRSSFLGLLELKEMECQQSWIALNIDAQSIAEMISPKQKDTPENLQLEEEATLLYQQLFNHAPNDSVIQRYVQAHNYLIKPNKQHECDMGYIFENRLDLEALELVLRGHRTLLTKKLLLVMYLSEMEREHIEDFYAHSPAHLKGLIVAGLSVFRTVWKYIKGYFILWRHPLCMMQ